MDFSGIFIEWERERESKIPVRQKLSELTVWSWAIAIGCIGLAFDSDVNGMWYSSLAMACSAYAWEIN